MKKFIINTIAFTLIVFLIAMVVDFVISEGLRKTERLHFYTMNKLMNDSINADVVILGNSRAAGSYHPTILDTILDVDSRNLGVSGQPFGVSCLLWKLYQRHNKNPKLLIINIDYSELKMVSNGFEKEQYYPYMRDTLVRPYLDLYGFSWAEKHIPMYRYRGNFKLMSIGLMELFNIRHDAKGDYIKGYSNKDWNWEGEKLEYVLQNGGVKGVCDQQTVALLEKLLEDVNKKDIPVVFVYAPMFKRLKDNLDEQLSMDAYRRLSQQYGVPILDFSDMSICSDTTFFHDANHVNSIGAERFSAELAHCLDSLDIIKN